MRSGEVFIANQLKSGPRKYLRRYTHLPAAIHMLRSRSLTLLDPSSWDDGNDTFYLNEYKRKNSLKSVLAVCLSEADESYHFWKIFAGNPSGVCIRLRQGSLVKELNKHAGVIISPMDYRKMTTARRKELQIQELPFVKRAAYADEEEVRVLWKSLTEVRTSLELPIPLSCIARITLSPWLPKGLVEVTKKALQSIEGCETIEVYRSSITGSEEWKSIARKL